MAQLTLRFGDDEGGRKADPLSSTSRQNGEKSGAPSPTELAILRQVELEDELARLTTPEERQRLYARFADQERRAVRELRRGG